MLVQVGWAEFDTLAAPVSVQVGWAEFDARAQLASVQVSWAEFDARSPDNKPVPRFAPGGGVARYHSNATKKYSVPVEALPDEEEEIIIAILMEIAAHVI